MSDGTPVVETAPDLANVEEAFWNELEGGLEGKDVESEDGGSPAAIEDNDAPEEEPQDGGDSAPKDGGESDSDSTDEDAIPLDDESEGDDSDPENGAPDGDEEDDGDNSREPTEDELTVRNAAERIKSAQTLMHEATSEASQLRRERQADIERIKALEAKLEETQSSIDSGTAKSRRDQRREMILSKLSDEQKENFELYGDMIEATLDALEAANGKPDSDETLSGKPKAGEGGPSPEQQEKINSWKDGVLNQAPDWFDLIHTDEWHQFREQNPGFMTAVTNRYDNLDPAGAIQMHKGFQRWKDKQSHTQTRSPKPSGSPKGKTVASPGGRTPPVKSRSAIEQEAWAEFGG